MFICGYGALSRQAQFAWLMNINARVECACKPKQDATGRWSATMKATRQAVLAKGANTRVGTVLV